MQRRPSYSEADLRRAMRAARKEGFQGQRKNPEMAKALTGSHFNLLTHWKA